MKKILLSLFALLAVTFSANAETKEVVFDYSQPLESSLR